MTDPIDTEDRLRDAFEAFAAEVNPAPDAYRRARNSWLRSEQRRRLILAIVIAVVFSLSVLIGIWVLNHASPTQHIIFNNTGSVGKVDHPADAASSAQQVWPLFSP